MIIGHLRIDGAVKVIFNAIELFSFPLLSSWGSSGWQPISET